MPQDRTESARADAPGGGVMPGVPAPAKWLGLAGLIPFAGGAFATVALDGRAAALSGELLAGYGAVILSFLGGCRWGFAAAGLGRENLRRGAGGARQEWLRYAVSVVPALYAWPVLAMGDPLRAGMLAAGFLVLLGGDVVLTEKGGAPAWWPTLRRPLSIGAAACLGLAAAFG